MAGSLVFAAACRTLVLTVCGLIAASSALGQDDPIAGVYVLAEGDEGAIETAIDAAVEKMNFIKRPIARGRLKKTNPVYRRIAITRSEGYVELQFDDRAAVRMPNDGSAIKWTREDGEVFDVSATWQDNSLVQTFKAGDGQRVNAFHLDDKDRLALDVTVSSPQLPAPVKYTLVYRRE